MKKALTAILICAFAMTAFTAIADVSTTALPLMQDLKALSTEDLEFLKASIIAELKLRELGLSEEPIVPTPDPNDLGIWAEKYFVDSFKEPTDEKYVSTKTRIQGTFSNSAATNRELTVVLLISGTKEPLVGIDLYEYGSNRVKNGGLHEADFTMTVRDDQGGTHYFPMYMNKKGERLYIKKDTYFGESDRDFINILKNSKTVKCNLTDNDKYSVSKYSFTIDDTTGFAVAYDWLGIPEVEE